MHMKASPSCCRFALNLGKQLTTPRGSNPSMICGDKKKKASPRPAEEEPIKMMTTSIVHEDNSTISTLTEVEYVKIVPIPGYLCPNPNCPKSKTKRYTGRGYNMHLKAFESCNNYIAMALWYQYRHLKDAHERPAKRTITEDEDSSIMTPVSDDSLVLSDDCEDHPHAGQHSCPNPNCPKSKSERYSNHEYSLHMNASTSCFIFVARAVRNHGMVVTPIQE